MKKTILFFALFSFLALGNTFAQCTPVPFPPPALTNPDASMGIPPAVATQVYSEVINLRIPIDTNIMGATLAIDSVGVDSITGIPSVFSYATNSLNDYWLGGTYGCFIVQGTPAQSDTGSYNLTIFTTIYLGGNIANKQIHTETYNFVILDSATVGFRDVNNDQFVVRQNAPNPFDYSTTIKFHAPNADVFTFEVYGVDGKLVRSEMINADKGINKIAFVKGDLPSGIYIYQIKNDKYNVRKRMIIR